MVYVPAGQFEMGYSDAQVEKILRMNSDGQREWFEAEQPAHAVALDAFWIDQTEVTNAQFCTFLNKQGNQREEGISWLDPGTVSRCSIPGNLYHRVVLVASFGKEHPVHLLNQTIHFPP